MLRSRRNEKYTFEYKLHVVELYLSSEVSYQNLALQERISNPAQITKWVNDFRIAGPDALRPKKKGRHKKITTDTTEFKYYDMDSKGHVIIKKLYLDTFMDLCNREIISYGISPTPSAKNIMDALNAAIEITSDCPYRRTFHSDQGWGYQMKAYAYVLQEHRIFQSMSRKGNCHDNSMMENFFGIMKQEMYYGVVYYSYDELKKAIEKYIKYYNEQRIKQKLGWMSPVEYRLSLLAV